MDGQTKQKRVLNEADTVIRNVRAKQQVSINFDGIEKSQRKNVFNEKVRSTAMVCISTPDNSDSGLICLDSKGLFPDGDGAFGSVARRNGICMTNHDAPRQSNNSHPEKWEKSEIIFTSTSEGSQLDMNFAYSNDVMATYGPTYRRFFRAEYNQDHAKMITTLGTQNIPGIFYSYNKMQILPASGANNAYTPGKALTVDGDIDITGDYYKDGVLFGSGGGGAHTTTFLALTDTPSSFTASKFLAVNSAGNAIELVDEPSGGGGGGGSSTATDYLEIGDIDTRTSALHIRTKTANATKPYLTIELDKAGFTDPYNGIELLKIGNAENWGHATYNPNPGVTPTEQAVRLYSDYKGGGLGGDNNFIIDFISEEYGFYGYQGEFVTTGVFAARKSGSQTKTWLGDEEHALNGINYAWGDLRYSGALSSFSDGRFKQNQQEVDYKDCYDKVKKLKLKTYKWDLPKIKGTDTELGFIAQEVEQVIPDVVDEDDVFNVSDFKCIDYNKINLYLFGAVRQLINQNETMQIRIEELEKLMG